MVASRKRDPSAVPEEYAGRFENRAEGTSLLELVLAAALLSALSLSLALIVVPVAAQSRITQEIQTADFELQSVLERLYATPFADLTTDYPDGTEIPVQSLPAGKVTVEYPDPTANPLEIHLTISWSSADLGNTSRTYTTLRAE